MTDWRRDPRTFCCVMSDVAVLCSRPETRLEACLCPSPRSTPYSEPVFPTDRLRFYIETDGLKWCRCLASAPRNSYGCYVGNRGMFREVSLLPSSGHYHDRFGIVLFISHRLLVTTVGIEPGTVYLGETWWAFRFSRRRVWRRLSSGMLHRALW
jgi:hypothetical protein